MTAQTKRVVEAYEVEAFKATLKLKENELPFLTEAIIWDILAYELDCSFQPLELYYYKLTARDIINLVKSFYLKYGMLVGFQQLYPGFTHDNTLLFNQSFIQQDEHTWHIHTSHHHPWPKRTVIHDYKHRVQLHLSTGEKHTTAGAKGRIHKKDLLEIRAKIAQQFLAVELPPMLV